MAMKSRAVVALLLSLCFLSACGDGMVTIRPTPFASFDTIQPNQPAQASGISQTVSATADASGVIQSRIVVAPDAAGTSAQLLYDNNLALTDISIRTSQSSATWSGIEIACGLVLCRLQKGGLEGATANATALLDWNYQTFGYWLDSTVPGTRNFNAVSVGNPTPVNGIPVAGIATYNGAAGGFVIDATGAVFEHASTVTAITNFGMQTINFATTNTQTNVMGSTTITPAPELNIAGTLGIVPGQNRFTGTVTTAGPNFNMSGTTTGQFYGPTAQEIGGAFALTGTGVQMMQGSFGGKQ
jgi:hypothetical protein